MFAGLAPSVTNNRAQEIAEAPAPLIFIFISDILRSVNSTAFTSPAPEMIAVPC